LNHQFKIGAYRPIYLWGGPGTIRMNKIKFMDYPVDERAHMAVHEEETARLVVKEINANWVHLMYDWGFPPEVEAEDWEDFRKGAEAYHKVGSPVFAYIQTSNCVFQGSFKDKDWYALDPRGKKIFYYSGRYMVDWTHPEWIQHLKAMIEGALSRGADGIFFDNMWYGEQPNNLLGAWIGGAGCYCERCRSLYRRERDREIPKKILPDREEVADYLRWRASHVTETIAELSGYVHQLKPEAPISANDYDVTMRNSYLVYGIDVAGLAKIQDVIMVENFSLPHLELKPKAKLVNNALTIRNTRQFVKEQAHLSVLSYDYGIGFDPVYPARRHQQAIAEAAACGASMTIKGTEYNDGQKMTMLTDRAYHAQHLAIGKYHSWLEQHQDLYQNRYNAAPVALLHPEEELWRCWNELAEVYFGVSQVLTWSSIPWRVARSGESLDGIKTLLTFSKEDKKAIGSDESVAQIHVPDLTGWGWGKQSLVARGGFSHNIVEGVGLSLLNAYHAHKFTRQVMDKMNMAKWVLATPYFDLPDKLKIDRLQDALSIEFFPRVESQAPVLIEIWKKDTQTQVHLMNYNREPQEIRLAFETPIRGKLISPDQPDSVINAGTEISFILDIYSVLILNEQMQ
jgi:hypothetical protein